MTSFWKVLRVLCAVFLFIAGVFVAMYFLNLDQRLLDWGYRQYSRLRGDDDSEA